MPNPAPNLSETKQQIVLDEFKRHYGNLVRAKEAVITCDKLLKDLDQSTEQGKLDFERITANKESAQQDIKSHQQHVDTLEELLKDIP